MCFVMRLCWSGLLIRIEEDMMKRRWKDGMKAVNEVTT